MVPSPIRARWWGGWRQKIALVEAVKNDTSIKEVFLKKNKEVISSMTSNKILK